MASRALLASSSKRAGAELVRGGLLEDQKAGQCYSGVEDLTSNDLCGLGTRGYPNRRMKPRALLLEGGWLGDQQGAFQLAGAYQVDQLEVAGADQLVGEYHQEREPTASRH